MKRAAIVTASIVLASLCFGSLAHAAIPHEHYEEGHRGESLIWQTLHAALRHDGKQIYPLLAIAGILGILSAALFDSRFRVKSPTVLLGLEMALRRGILPHRKFG